MPALSDYTHSPAWWVTAVILAVLLNIAGSYAVRLIDRCGGQIITQWSTRTAAKRQRKAQMIAAVRADVGRLIWVGFQAQSLRISSLFFVGCALVAVAVAELGPPLGMEEVTRLLLVLVGFFAAWVAMFLGGRAADLEAVIRGVEPEWPELPSA